MVVLTTIVHPREPLVLINEDLLGMDSFHRLLAENV